MNRVKLMDCCVNITDGEHGSVTDTINGHYFLLSSKNIVDSNIHIDHHDRKINEESFLRLKNKTKLEIGDVIISSVGTIGKTAVIEGEINYVFQRSVGIIKTNSKILNPYYLKYELNTPEFQKRLQRLSNGGLQKGLYIGDLQNLIIDCPEISKQEKVTKLLRSFDKKINNNNKIISKLESMSKTLYDYWFLQFDFPNEEGKPYKSSGGKMVYNNELKREIPEGREVISLCKLVKKNNTKFISDKEDKVIDLSNMQSNSVSLLQFNSTKDFSTNLYEMKKFDLLFGSIRPYLHKACFAPFNGAVTGTVYSYKVENIENFNFVLALITSDLFFKYAVSNSQGTKMPVVKSERLLEYKFAFNNEISKKFGQILSSKEKIANCINENQELSSLRDFLLPMLMNGQVTFK